MDAQLVVKLDPRTIAEYDRYRKTTEAEIDARWTGKKQFFAIAENRTLLDQVRGGEISIRQQPQGAPTEIYQGLIHDWIGDIYIPQARPADVIAVLRNFDEHKNIYPEIADSRIIQQSGDTVTGYWKLQRKGMVPVVLEVEQKARYRQLTDRRWTIEVDAQKISEVDMTLFARGHKYPPGEGHGFLWRLNAYWMLEAVDGGVLAECRTLSLSRDIPQSLAWAIAPYVEKTPHDSLLSTLRETRRAVAEKRK